MPRPFDTKVKITHDKLVEAFNDLCRSHNDLVLAHDVLVREFTVMADLVDQMVEVIFESNQELDS